LRYKADRVVDDIYPIEKGKNMKNLLCIFLLVICCTSAISAEESKPRTITVTGKGQIEVEPDYAKVVIGATITNRDAAKAKTEIDKIFKKLVAVFKELKINEKDINTSRLYIEADYDYTHGSVEFKGYEAMRYALVTVRDLDKLNALIQKSLEAGATQLGGIQLLSTKETEHRDEALRQAVGDAKKKAALLANEFGVSVGTVLQIQCVDPKFDESYDEGYVGAMLMTAMEPDVGSFMHGHIKFEAQVTVEFELITKN
jgi:uncharacterized protein YggE